MKELVKYYWENPYKYVVEVIGAVPTDQQAAILQVIPQAIKERKGIAVKSGHGCFGKGTKIMLYNGDISNVEDIKTGDLLMGDDETPRKVLGLYRGTENLYEFELTDRQKYIFNESHILCLVSSQSHGTQKSGEKFTVTVRDWLKWSDRKKRTNCFYREKIGFSKFDNKLKIDPYILGCWLGDGIKGKPNICSEDDEVIISWKENCNKRNLLFKNYKNIYRMSSGRNGGHVKNNFSEDLKYYNILNNKEIPVEYLKSSIFNRLQLLAGLIDTDGTLDKRNKRIFSISQKNKKMSEQILYLVKSIGLHGTLREVKKHCYYKNKKREGIYYEINISRNTEIIPTRIKRKQGKKINNPQRNNLHFGIKNVNYLGKGKYYGFELNGNHKFLGGDFAVLHNTGKTALEAWIVHWFMACAPFPKIPCTAPTQHQLYDILWPELSKWNHKAKNKDLFEWRKTHFFCKQHEENWFAVAQTGNNPDAMQGFHAENLLFVVEEASGVPTDVLEVIEGTQTQEGSLVMMFGNPTQVSGGFYDAFYSKRKFYYTFTLNAEETPLVHPSYYEKIAAKYGRDSDVYRVRVLGEFPKADPDTLISLDKAEKAAENDFPIPEAYEIVEIGADIARFGGDEITVYSRIGNVIREEYFGRKQDTMITVGAIVEVIKKYHRLKQVYVNVDDGGVGGGVTDRLKELAYQGAIRADITGVNNGSSAVDKDNFINCGTEMWFYIRDHLTELNIPDDNDLIGQLTTRKYKFSSTGKNMLERKEEMKNRGLPSPDRADGLILTFRSLIYGLGKKGNRAHAC